MVALGPLASRPVSPHVFRISPHTGDIYMYIYINIAKDEASCEDRRRKHIH